MNLSLDVGRIDEHRAKVLDVRLDAVGLMTVGPRHHDVLCLALAEAISLLVAEDVEVARVESFQIEIAPIVW